jgi:hypothetical protein
VLILAAVTAVIASGFVYRSANEAKLATRSYYSFVALNLAEAGIEEGLFAANSANFSSTNGWALASGSSTDYVKSITSGFAFQQATGAVYIRVDAGMSNTPTVTAMGVISIPRQPTVLKQLHVTGIQRHLWGNGIVVKGTLTFSGNASVDSYDSSVGVYNSTTNRSDQATVATTSTALDPITVGSSATIYGYVATGAADPVVGSSGRIYGLTTPSGTNVDTSRIRHDFTANLPDVSAPTTAAISLPALEASITLPRAGDAVGANGRYLYTVPSVGLGGGDAVEIADNVDLIVTGNVSVSGNAAITLDTGSTSFNLYCPGTIAIGGNGMNNTTNLPINAAIWGTAPSTSVTPQSITISGNGSFKGTIYAPNANVAMTGSGENNGAVIAKSATIGGSGKFHYDVRLASARTPLDSSYHLTSWCELTATPGSTNAFARDNRSPFTSLF